MPSRQSSPTLIVLGIVVLAAVGWLVIQLAGSPPEAPPDAVTPSEVAGTGPGAAGDPLAAMPAEDPGADPTTAHRETSGEARVEAGPLQAAEAGAGQSVAGRVILPQNTPGDETLFVIGLEREAAPRRIYGGEALADVAWEPEVERDGVLGFAPVEPDGRFRLTVPEDEDVVHLALSGRYVYSEGTTECALPASNGGVVLSGELGAWITGRVLAPVDGGSGPEPAAGIETRLGPDVSGAFDARRIEHFAFEVRDRTDDAGVFEFRAVPSQLSHGMLIRATSLATHVQLGLRPGPGVHLELEVPLKSGARLLGRVVDEGGAGIEDVEVGALLPGPIGEEAGDLCSTETAEDGAFALEHVALGKVVLRAEAEGFRNTTLPIGGELFDGQEIDGLELVLERGESIRGTVRFDGGAPAAGARVRVRPDASQLLTSMGAGFDPRDGGSTDVEEDGSFEVSGLGNGPFVVTAGMDLEEGDLAGRWAAREEGIAGGRQDLALTMDRLLSLRARVTDLAGEPVESFRLRATLEGSGGMLGIGAVEAVRPVEDSEDGTTLLEDMLRAGTWSFEVTAAGYASASMKNVAIPLPPGVEELVFALEPAASISGMVLDTFGNPIQGATIARELTIPEAVAASRSGDQPTATSDSQGGFLLADLDPGSVPITATKDGFASSETVTVDVVSGQVAENVVLKLRIGGLLTGEVLDDEGQPVVGRMVIVRSSENPMKQHLMPTDGNGEFRVEHLAPGNYQVISTRNFMTGEVDMRGSDGLGDLLADLKMEMVDIVDGEEIHIVLGRPPEDPVTIVGLVVHDGEPVPGVMVSMIPETSETLSNLKIATADGDGRFQITLERRGAYLVTVQNVVGAGMQNSVEFQERIPAEGEQHQLTLELPHGRISGRVLGPDREPAAGCRVTLGVEGGIHIGSFLGGNYAEVSTDAEGGYDITYLRPGRYTLAAGGSLLGGMLGDTGSPGGRVIRSGIEVSEGEWLSDVDFELAEPGQLTGTVHTPDGATVAGASIFVRDEAGRLLERLSLVVSDSAGRFTYPGLAPGDYTVVASLGDQVSPPDVGAHVPEGGAGEVEVTLDVGITLVIKAEDGEREPLRARISVVDSEGREVNGMISLQQLTDAFREGFQGEEQRVGPLPPGKYTVTATLDDGRQEQKKVTLNSRRLERHVTVRFD